MTPQEVNDAIAKIDGELATRKTQVGVQIGGDLYKELANGGHVTLETYTIAGIPGAYPRKLPTYKRKAFAFADPFIAPDAFNVGIDPA